MVKPIAITGMKSIAATLGVSVRTVARWRIECGLPAVNVTPRTVLVEREALARWLSERGRTAEGEAVAGSVP